MSEINKEKTLGYNSVAQRLFWELRNAYPTGEDIPFETFAKTDVGLSDAEYRMMNRMCDLSVNDIQDNRLKEIICCEMAQLQLYFSENFENGKEELEKCLINDVKIPSTQIEEMRNTGYFNDWISGLDEKDR